MSGDTVANQIRDELTNRLTHLYDSVAEEEWFWFEEILSYDNAVIPRALIVSGQWTGNEKAFDIGFKIFKMAFKNPNLRGRIFQADRLKWILYKRRLPGKI